MTSDQRRCIQRSKSVCRILVFVCNEIKRIYIIVNAFIRLTAAILSVQFRLREVTRWKKTEFVRSSLATQPE